MPVSKDGQYVLETDMSIFDCKRLQANTPKQREKEMEEGPLYQIVYSLNQAKTAAAQKQRLIEQHKATGVRVRMIPSRQEYEMLAKGEFTIAKRQRDEECDEVSEKEDS